MLLSDFFPANLYVCSLAMSSTLLQSRTTILSGIKSPEDLKGLSFVQLKQLAEEIRQQVIQSVSKTGGHLASNLGVVETTLALHYVFDSPGDKIIWDVGHQAYVHKMLTGRCADFETLRQYQGLSGFINPLESPHDPFLAGHSSTSISLAVGMAIARDRLNQDHKIVALIGDGGLTGGMALEAINHLGHMHRNVLIILNDNEMSISENLGGFSQYMKRIKESFFYRDLKEKIDEIEIQLDDMQLHPGIRDLIKSVKRQAKQRFDTPGIVFDKLGINYSGPVDGHDVEAVIESLQKLKDRPGPQLLHLITQKGKGYEPAEQDSIKYHGVSAFSLEKVEPVQEIKPKAKTYSDVFTQSLIELAEIEPNMVAITPATAEGSGLVKFGKVYPQRFFDVAICEQHAVTMAAGMAKAGLLPVVSIYSTFLQRAIDQVIHDVAILNLPVIFGIDRGGLVEDGETHQGVFDIAHLRAIPNLSVWAPSDTRELRNMLYTALKQKQGPVAIRFPRDKALNAEESSFEMIEPQRWPLVELGNDAVILAYGAMVEVCKQASILLKKQGINVGLVNARTCKPLDENCLQSLMSTGQVPIFTAEEGVVSGGFGSAVLEWISAYRLRQKLAYQPLVVNLGVKDAFVEHGARQKLLDLQGLTAARVAEQVASVVNAK